MHRGKDNSGLTLLELLMAMSIISILAGVTSRVLMTALEAWDYSRHQSEAIHSACWALDHITSRARASNRLLLPFRGADPNHPPEVLAFSAMIDTDGDGLVDEDQGADITADGAAGILGVDDDADGSVDESTANDDDEDGFYFFWWWQVNEDCMDGVDNNGDGFIDEDPPSDINDDGYPGIAGKDDDGDGSIDEGDYRDDDEDGQINEDPVEYWVYYLDPNSSLVERYGGGGQPVVLLERVTAFEVSRTESGSGRSGFSLVLGVSTPDGEDVRLRTMVYLKGITH
ncbi:MAG: prepilin-type N-terminal cleavage/methylation domain-containing protein [bacterium]